MLLFNTLPSNLVEYLHQSYIAKTRFIGLYFRRRQYGSTYHFDRCIPAYTVVLTFVSVFLFLCVLLWTLVV